MVIVLSSLMRYSAVAVRAAQPHLAPVIARRDRLSEDARRVLVLPPFVEEVLEGQERLAVPGRA